ncbi:hypothetical protein SanaruYs_32040 [Chryseotalea sanaruensis]|uniref:Uncharacterized protein n=1 Tax=Chryseotalea sanaruensis TaxID=2482724 RepID=A0A401UDL5_9BACT|nr:hypothetical protein [Chryseotalea sanaruensis]GCC52963.1 hypothetical protein SanaruYs_32040 [Chryseotalea sanaruensis]
MKKLVALILLLVSSASEIVAQCAMCRTQLENNVSNGDPGIAAGLNIGILYLLIMPYLAIMVLGYFWYKSSRKNASKLGERAIAR